MTIARIAQDLTGRGGRRDGARGSRGGGGVTHGNSQFDNDRRLKHPWNSGSLQQMGASPQERSFSTNPCSPANFVEGLTSAFEAGEL